MIFVTVGTHEQSFERLVKEVDNLKGRGIIKDEVFIQTGYTEYEPRYCLFKMLLDYEEMKKYINEADIIITHGGPASFMSVLEKGKIPIVVPRQEQYKEHINNHQLEFANAVKQRYKNIIVVEDVSELREFLENYSTYVDEMNIENLSNNDKFCTEFSLLVKKMLCG